MAALIQKCMHGGCVQGAEENLRVAHTTASSSLGQLIALGENFSAAYIQKCMEVVSSSMPKMGHRAHKSYEHSQAYIVLEASFEIAKGSCHTSA